MRHSRVPLLCLLCLCLIALIAGCGSTVSSSGGSTDSGTFTLGAEPALTIAQGQSITLTVTPASTNQFTGSIQVSVSGLPAGVTVSPANATVAMGSSTTFTLTAAADAAVGTTTVKVYGSSGTLSTNTPVALTVTATTPSNNGDFALTASPTTLTLAPGASGQVTLSSTASSSFSGTIAIAVDNLPTGVTASPATISLSPNNPVVVTLTAASDAPATATPAQVTFVGTSGAQSAQATVALTVTAVTPPTSGDFTLAASPATLMVMPGASGNVTLSSIGLGSFGGTIAIAVKNLPSGVTASPAQISLSPNNPVVVTLTAASNAPATPTPVQVSFVGTSGTLSHTATMLLTVGAVAPTGPDFSITVDQDTVSVAQGDQSGAIDIGVTGVNGFAGVVTYTVSGLPAGVTAVPPTSKLQDGWTEPMIFRATADAAIGDATVTITGTSGVLTHTATVLLTVTAPPPPDFVALALSPASETITVGSIGTVSITATATDGFTGTVNVSAESLPTGVTMMPATAALTPGVPRTFTLVASANAKPGTATVTFLGQVNSVNGSADLSLTIASAASHGLDVPTWHYDMARSGLNSSETVLTPATVNATTFRKYGIVPTDGAIDVQPLYISGVTVGAQTHNILFLATENDTVYAWDAVSGTHLWQASALEANETAADNQGCSELPAQVGITATPVIDRNFGPDGAIYFVAKTKDSDGNYHQRLHALDMTTGAELSGSPVEITATSGTNSFDPGISVERAALLVNNGIVYLSWGAPCHQTTFDYSGWVMAYNEGTLEQLSVLDLTPNGSGGGVWMSGAGPAGDANGNVFLATSTGTFDTTLNASGKPKNGDYGNGYIKIESPNGVMTVYDYFEPLNGVPGAANYADQGSGGIMLTPGFASSTQFVPPQGIGAGKDGNIYQLGTPGNVLGEYNGTTDNNYKTVTAALPNGATSTPAYFNNAFYYGGSGDVLREFTLSSSGAALATRSTSTLGTAGATPVITANGTNTAILWALDTTASGGAVLHAYDATNLATELYNSTQAASGRDAIGATDKHAVPLIANGFVYIGTESGLAILGPLP